MTPFPTDAEVKALQAACSRAWNLSRLAFGHEKMRLIAEAFPFAIDRSEAEGALWIKWHPRMESFSVSDFGGFVTMIPQGDLETLLSAVKMEFQQKGAFRETITGEKAKPRVARGPKKATRTQKKKLSLKDLGL